MSIHNDYGFEDPVLQPFYEGLRCEGGKIVAVTGSVLNGQKITSLNDLSATVDMVFFTCDYCGVEALDHQHELQPLIDLVYANMAMSVGDETAPLVWGPVAVASGVEKLTQGGLIPVDKQAWTIELLAAHKDRWPQSLAGLFRDKQAAPCLRKTQLGHG